jgi:hypothetical protein
VRRHHGIRNAIGRRGLRQGERVGEVLRTVVDAWQKMTVQVDHAWGGAMGSGSYDFEA